MTNRRKKFKSEYKGRWRIFSGEDKLEKVRGKLLWNHKKVSLRLGIIQLMTIRRSIGIPSLILLSLCTTQGVLPESMPKTRSKNLKRWRNRQAWLLHHWFPICLFKHFRPPRRLRASQHLSFWLLIRRPPAHFLGVEGVYNSNRAT